MFLNFQLLLKIGRSSYVIFNIRFNSDDAVKEALDDVLIDIDIVRWDAMQ